MNKVNFKQWRGCDVHLLHYMNGLPAIRLTLDGEPIATATINPEDDDGICQGEIVVKNYSECEGMLDALMEAGIVSEPLRYIPAGFVTVPVCKLLVSQEGDS